MAVATGHGRLIAVVAQGRVPDEEGLTLSELADVLAELGAVDAMNLDGGSSACLIGHGEMRNTPRESDGSEDPHGGRRRRASRSSAASGAEALES